MSKKSRQDLLLRVRYVNPLPPPPFPPKLFDVPSDIRRLGEPSYLAQLASTTPVPMLVDSEMGMPMDLNSYHIWDGDDSALNPTPGTMDAEDAILMAPVSAVTERPSNDVSWMRTSNLFMRKTQGRRRAETHKDEIGVDASGTAQIDVIDQGFDACHEPPQDAKRHIIESYDILPDEHWGEVSYIMIKFPDRPSGTKSNDVQRPSSPRLKRALLLPRDAEGQQEIDYFLPKEEDLSRLHDVFERAVGADVVEQVQELAEEDSSDTRIDEILPSTHYEKARTYETVSAVQPQKEIIMTFEGDKVYYRDVYMRTLLRKARAKQYTGVDKMRVGYSLPSEDDMEMRSRKQHQVTDPAWAEQQMPMEDAMYDVDD